MIHHIFIHIVDHFDGWQSYLYSFKCLNSPSKITPWEISSPMTQNYLTLEGPVPSSQHAGLMHPFRCTTCTKHDSAYCNVTHRGRVWLHISTKMDDNSVVLRRHLPIKALHFSHPHIIPCLVCVTVYIIALMNCVSLLIVYRVLITASCSSISINYQSFNLNYIAAYQSLYIVRVSLTVTLQNRNDCSHNICCG